MGELPVQICSFVGMKMKMTYYMTRGRVLVNTKILKLLQDKRSKTKLIPNWNSIASTIKTAVLHFYYTKKAGKKIVKKLLHFSTKVSKYNKL